MALIILFPAVLCWVAMAWGSVRKAVVSIYIPCLLLLPHYFNIRLPHLPAITFADAAILPIGFALLLTEMRFWRFAWMDLWVFLYALAVVPAQGFSTEIANGTWVHLLSAQLTFDRTLGTHIADSGMMFFARLVELVLPYMVGKLLIERAGRDGLSMRRAIVARIAVLLSIVGYLSIGDFLKGGNTWKYLGEKVFPDQPVFWEPQMRWGFGRIAGPYGHAILAGMIFLVGLLLCLWLRRVDPAWGRARVVASLPVTKRGVVAGGLLLGLLMTQSRGPWLGMLLALGLALLTRVLSTGKAVVAFLLLVTVFFTVLYYFGNKYTDMQMDQARTEEQRSAVYRRELLAHYAPIVAERKLFGWGITTYPVVPGQSSIDNQYLLLAVTEGFFGLSTFLLIAAGSSFHLLHLVAQPLAYEDRLLAFAHLAILIGLLTTLTTVFMGEQVGPIFFFLTGWIQGMNPPRIEGGETGFPGFRRVSGFRRVIV